GRVGERRRACCAGGPPIASCGSSSLYQKSHDRREPRVLSSVVFEVLEASRAQGVMRRGLTRSPEYRREGAGAKRAAPATLRSRGRFAFDAYERSRRCSTATVGSHAGKLIPDDP